jgi:hypothetical protein
VNTAEGGQRADDQNPTTDFHTQSKKVKVESKQPPDFAKLRALISLTQRAAFYPNPGEQ